MKIISFKYNLSNKNCEDDTDVMLQWAYSNEESQQAPLEQPILNIPVDIADADNDNEVDANLPGISQLEAQVLPYYTGYTVFSKFVKKLKCEKCLEMATASSNAPSASIFTTHKAFNVENVVVTSDLYNDISKYFFT